MTNNSNNGLKTKILAVKENNKILAYGTFIYFQYKKFFYKVTAQFGPIMNYSNIELVKFYMTELKKYFSKDFRVLSVRVNPFINEKYFKDIEYISENQECTLEEIKTMLKNRFDSIDFLQARKDVEPFIRDTSVLDIWSSEFFKQITEGLKVL